MDGCNSILDNTDILSIYESLGDRERFLIDAYVLAYLSLILSDRFLNIGSEIIFDSDY